MITLAIIGERPSNTLNLVLLLGYNRYTHYNSEIQSSIATPSGRGRRCWGPAVDCCTRRVLAVTLSLLIGSQQVLMF